MAYEIIEMMKVLKLASRCFGMGPDDDCQMSASKFNKLFKENLHHLLCRMNMA